MAIVAKITYSQSYALPLSPMLAVAYGTGWVKPGDPMKPRFLLDSVIGRWLCFVVYTAIKMFIPLP